MLTIAGPEISAPSRTAARYDDDATCRACHPGPTRGLLQGPHAILLDRESEHASCTSCHGDQSAHATSRIDPKLTVTKATPVLASSCTPCHKDRNFPPSAAVHPWTRKPLQEQKPPKTQGAPLVPDLNIAGTDWSAMAAAGWRFLDKRGSRNRYDTDINLDRGPRLMELELEGITRGKGAWMDLVRISATDIDDPYQKVTGLIEKNGRYRAEAGFQKTAVSYSALGNFHRVDRKSQETSFASSIELTDNLEFFGGFSRFMQEGFWLTNRISDLHNNTIDDVESPRSLDAEEGELGLSGTAWDTQFTVALEYENDKDRNRWRYSRPASNPSFPQSEDFTSHGHLSGPGLRWSLSRSFDAFSIEHSGRYLDRDQTISADGKKTGYSTTPFNTTTTAAASGQAHTWICDTSATMEIASWASLLVDTRYLDHAEEMKIEQTDVIFFPILNTTTTETTNRSQRTTQRSLEGSIQFDLRPQPYLDLTAGYGWSNEDLTVPKLDNADFHSGRIRTDGVLLGAAFRPDDHWTLGASLRNFGQSGIQLHDIVEDESRLAELQLRHRRDSWQAQAWARHRRRANDISSMRNETSSAGISGSWNSNDSFDLHTSYVFSDIDSRTLTNFYFDPDPDPVPTFVGFDGQTHTVIAGIGFSPTDRIRWRLDAAYTDTSGSFDIGLLDWRSDLSVTVGYGGEAGVILRQVDYDEQGDDDYGSFMTFIYYRQRFGGNDQN